jgi:hypothetical protein
MPIFTRKKVVQPFFSDFGIWEKIFSCWRR